MRKYILILVSIIALTSCSFNNNDDINYYSKFVEVDDAIVPDSFELGETYDITVKYTLPDDCHIFNDIYYSYDATSRIIAVIALTSEDLECTGDAVAQATHTFSVKATQSEPYVFKFWQGENDQGEAEYLTIEVPVTD